MGNLLSKETPVGDAVAMQKKSSNEFTITPQGNQETSRTRKKPYFNLENQQLNELPSSVDEQDKLEPMQIEEYHRNELTNEGGSSNDDIFDTNMLQDVQMRDRSIERGIKFAASQISTVERERYVRAKQKRVKGDLENDGFRVM
ncbi:9655_t:CDS:1 [Scutellospora calospora]|uniref:9655_t:CDS:1 n=1 Tax=Scutellospora calospora TaxID=85575 RepID=A0ACA9KIH5_9GLOM|nr:9655_t:CDS:1 [Scutellospora calospora]